MIKRSVYIVSPEWRCVYSKTFLINQTNKKIIYCVVMVSVWKNERRALSLHGHGKADTHKFHLHTIFIIERD